MHLHRNRIRLPLHLLMRKSDCSGIDSCYDSDFGIDHADPRGCRNSYCRESSRSKWISFDCIVCDFLEKYLVTITGYAAFKIFIPVACVLFAVNMAVQNRSVDKLARRLFIFGICIFLVVPTSVKVSDLIETTYQSQIDATLEDAKSTREMLENSSDSDRSKMSRRRRARWNRHLELLVCGIKAKDALSSAKDSVTTAVGNVTISSEELVQKVQDSLNHFVEAVAVMLITSCVIPILVLLVFFWLIKVLLDVDISSGKSGSGE